MSDKPKVPPLCANLIVNMCHFFACMTIFTNFTQPSCTVTCSITIFMKLNCTFTVVDDTDDYFGPM